MSFELIQPDFKDDFNYPSLSRKDLMYLDKINSRDFPIKKINQIDTKRDWSANLYNLDIESSVPKRNNIFTYKKDFINKTDDIEKAKPKKEFILEKPNFILDISDIERAHPKKLFWNSQRHVNPLNPVYKLPSYIKADPNTPPKFIRNQIDISDIAKTRPKKLYPLKMRPFKSYDEIKGVHPKKAYVRKKIHDSLNYSDLNIKIKKFRNTNPLEPQYEKPYDGIIKGNKPYLPLYHLKLDNSKNNLNINDIYGTAPGSLNHYANFRYDNKQRFDTRDIEGASADTKKRGIITNRCTNPLQPNYKYLGNNELFDCFGDKINNCNSNQKSDEVNKSLNNSKLKIYEEYQKQNNISNKFKYNNSNNLSFNAEFYNYPQIIRKDRKMIKSFSTDEVNRKFPFIHLRNNNNNKEEESIRLNFLKENEKNESQDYYYEKPFCNNKLNNDSFLKIGNINKFDRLNEKFRSVKGNKHLRELRKYYFRNNNYHDMAFDKINNSLKNKKFNINDENDIINSGRNTSELILDKNGYQTYENKIDNYIKRNGA